jgi:hypothetical protein
MRPTPQTLGVEHEVDPLSRASGWRLSVTVRLRRDIPERRRSDFARSVERLAEIFGSIQGALAEELVHTGLGRNRDLLLPGSR